MSQLVDVESPGCGAGACAYAEPGIPGLEEAFVVKLYLEVGDAR